jgi:aldose 1-epimerase
VKVATNLHLPTVQGDIPTGAIEPYPEFEANQEFTLGAEAPDPDHCFIINPDASSIPLDSRKEEMKKFIEMYHPSTKIHFEALTTEPAFQFYTGRKINVAAIDSAPARGPRSGLCLEASRYVNAINKDEWRQQVVLRKGQLWGSRTTYRAWVD